MGTQQARQTDEVLLSGFRKQLCSDENVSSSSKIFDSPDDIKIEPKKQKKTYIYILGQSERNEVPGCYTCKEKTSVL